MPIATYMPLIVIMLGSFIGWLAWITKMHFSNKICITRIEGVMNLIAQELDIHLESLDSKKNIK